MSDFYLSAAKRHLDDADLLLSGSHSDNAAYLSGYIIECAIKGLLRGETEIPPNDYRHDLPMLSGDVLLLACFLAPMASRYELPQSAEVMELIREWGPHLRYTRTGHIDGTKATRWVGAAKAVFISITVKLELDGRSGG